MASVVHRTTDARHEGRVGTTGYCAANAMSAEHLGAALPIVERAIVHREGRPVVPWRVRRALTEVWSVHCGRPGFPVGETFTFERER